MVLLSGCQSKATHKLERLEEELAGVKADYDALVEDHTKTTEDLELLTSSVQAQRKLLVDQDSLITQYKEERDILAQYSGQTDDADDFFKKDLPLILSLEEKDIRLYGCHPWGMILYVSGQAYYLDIAYMTPRFIMPELYVNDYDGDGEEEICLVTYIGSGTGVSIQNLYMIEMKNPNASAFENNMEKSMDLIKFDLETMDDLIEMVAIKANYETGYLEVISPGYEGEVAIKDIYGDYQDNEFEDRVSYGSIIRYGIDKGKVEVTLGLAMSSRLIHDPIYFGEAVIELKYQDNTFVATGMTIRLQD